MLLALGELLPDVRLVEDEDQGEGVQDGCEEGAAADVAGREEGSRPGGAAVAAHGGDEGGDEDEGGDAGGGGRVVVDSPVRVHGVGEAPGFCHGDEGEGQEGEVGDGEDD